MLYDDEELRVIWSPGVSDFVLITFGDLETPAKDLRFFADTPLEKSGISAIGVMAKRANWFPSKNIQQALDIILNKIDNFNTRVTYGGSMGGYAAIKFSRMLNATQVIALCPQWSIDPTECDGFQPGWLDFFTSAMRGMGIREADVSGNLFIFSDPFDSLDMFHYRKIAENHPQSLFVGVPMVGHNVTRVFAGTNNLYELIDACCRRAMTDLYKFSRHVRKRHAVYQYRILEHAMRKFPRLGTKYLSNVDRRHVLQFNRKYIPQILSHLISTFSVERAMAFYQENCSLFHNSFEQYMICNYLAHTTGQQTAIVTAHNSWLIYDFSKERVIHKTAPLSAWEVLLEAEVFGSKAKLFVSVGKARINLTRMDGDRLGILSDTSESTKRELSLFELQYCENGYFTISYNGKYFSAEANGEMVGNREAALGWEIFQFRPRVKG